MENSEFWLCCACLSKLITPLTTTPDIKPGEERTHFQIVPMKDLGVWVTFPV